MYRLNQFKQFFKIPYYANMHTHELGLDSLEYCVNKTHFKNFESVNYCFNELGFRTKSINEFIGNEIIAIGDSFTLGLGVNAQDRWTEQLESMLNYPVLNFSLNGASNDWIARRANQILEYFEPRALIIHWTFSHRRERPNIDWFDDERTECEPLYSIEENLLNWIKNYQSIQAKNVIHSVIPNWHDNFEYHKFNIIPPVQVIDLARDGFHYGPKTHRRLAEKFTNLLGFE